MLVSTLIDLFVCVHLQKVLKVDKAHFATMPGWKQTKLKKEAGLF